ncbi:DUF167 domain-containing protein [Patescibacteria group bacterium]|nr:DUF167 domain-containing protein [Patescibacteria group bacterium]
MIINVKVTPRASKNEVVKVSDNIYRIKVTVPPEKGMANEMVIQLLAKELKVPRSNISIKAGAGVREKLIEIK